VKGPIVLTGAGMVTAAGDTIPAVFGSLAARVGLAVRDSADGLTVAPIEAFDAKRYVARRGVRDLSRASQLACSAAAANAASLQGVPPAGVGVVFGSAWGALRTVIDFEREAHVQGPRFVDPILFTETVSNVPAGQVAIHYQWSAFNVTVSSGSASGSEAIHQALAFLEEDRGEVAVAGGGDELNRPILSALASRGPIAASGEGACLLTLESEDHATQRGAAPLARVRGSAARFNSELADLIRELLERASCRPEEIGIVVLSARGGRGDLDEAAAVLTVFGEGPEAPLVMIPKAVFGETWGASGPLAAVCAVEAIRTAQVPAVAAGFALGPELSRLNIPRESARPKVGNALILDRTDEGYQLGLVVSAMETHDERR
jgi:3-oxoacyl-(acyl-carrier-protein) synthase